MHCLKRGCRTGSPLLFWLRKPPTGFSRVCRLIHSSYRVCGHRYLSEPITGSFQKSVNRQRSDTEQQVPHLQSKDRNRVIYCRADARNSARESSRDYVTRVRRQLFRAAIARQPVDDTRESGRMDRSVGSGRQTQSQGCFRVGVRVQETERPERSLENRV